MFMLYGIESHGIIPTTINSVDTRTIDVGAVSRNGQNLELPPGGNFYREAVASAADRTVWALVYLCTRLELSLFFIRDRFLDEWLPNDLKRRRFTAVWNRGLCASVHTGTQ